VENHGQLSAPIAVLPSASGSSVSSAPVAVQELNGTALLRLSGSKLRKVSRIGMNNSTMSWEDVVKLSNLSQVNIELEIACPDDYISYSHDVRKYLEKSEYLLKECSDEFNSEAARQRREIPAGMQQGNQ
jgi:hypothetical protein